MNKFQDISKKMMSNKRQLVYLLLFLTGYTLLLMFWMNNRPGFLKVKSAPLQIAELREEVKEVKQGVNEISYWTRTQDSLNRLLIQNQEHLPTFLPLPPAKMSKVSSRYGRRISAAGDTLFHSGIDYAARKGTPVYARASGIVKKAERDDGYGNLIEIDSQNGIITKYAHLSRMIVSKNQEVKQGEQIGNVGSTGNSTGSHLHFEIELYNKKINPSLFR